MPNKRMKINPKHPEEWPLALRFTTLVAAFFITLGIGHYLFVSDNIQKRKKQHAYYEEMQSKFRTTFKKYHSYKQHELNLAHDRKSLDQIIESLPSKATTFQINNAITKTAKQSGLQITNLSSLPSESHGFYNLTPIKIQANSSYHQAARFISDIANLKQTIIVGDFSLQKPSNGQSDLSVNITLNLYQPSGSKQ